MAFGQEPEAAAGAVVPPFFLHAQCVGAHVQVIAPGRVGEVRGLGRAGVDFAAKTEFGHVAGAAVGAGEEEHGGWLVG